MKKILFPLMMVLSMLTFVACDKDDDNSGKGTNQVEVDGKTFKIEKGGQTYFGVIVNEEDEKLVNVDLGFILEDNYVLDLELALSTENKKLEKGTYTFTDKDVPAANTIFGGEFFKDKDEDSLVEVTGAKITVDVDGEYYTVMLDLTLEEDQKLTGSFYGKLAYEDESEHDEEETEE
ncbi:MAG: hypothetical protein LUG98_14115 [Tannerellaceae bacterium]|nr:hypothetical protein [Tannerellaceae bacterium]